MFKHHHLSTIEFLTQYIFYDKDVSKAREMGWGGREDLLSSTSVVLLRRTTSGVLSTAVVFGHPTIRPFGILPPPCDCDRNQLNAFVRSSKGQSFNFSCARCGYRTKWFTPPTWAKSLNRPGTFWTIPFPFPSWDSIAVAER